MSKNTLKEYLISLGFGVDDKQYNQAMKKMKGFESSAGKVAGNIGKTMAKGAAVATAALVSVTAGVITYTDSVAKADMETEKFAKRMWMTEENARSLQYSLKAMGEGMDTIYDVAANPELRAKFLKLRADAAKLEGSPEINQGLQEIRDFQFEFQRFQLLLGYGGRTIAYYLSKYLAEPMAEIKAKLKGINDDGQNFIKVWGERIAKALSVVIKLFAAGVQGIGDFIAMIGRLPGEIKAAMLAIAAIGLVMLNPFTLVIMAIGAILLLLEDFYTWQRGGKSLFGDMWAGLSDFKFESKAFDSIINFVNSLKDLFGTLGEKWLELNETFKEKYGFTIVEGLINGLDWLVSKVVDGLTWIVDLVNQLLKGEMPTWLEDFLLALSGTNRPELAQNQEKLDYWEGKFQTQTKDRQQPVKEVKSPSIKENRWSLGPKTQTPAPAMAAQAWETAKTKTQKPTLPEAKGYLPKIPIFNQPVMASPYSAATIANSKKEENHNDNSIKTDVKINVTGTDATAIALGVEDAIGTLLQRNIESWSNARINVKK